MKTFKWLLIVVTAVSFIAGVSYSTWSADIQRAPTMKKTTPAYKGGKKPVLQEAGEAPVLKVVYKCPTGWHLTEGSFMTTDDTRCVPNKPSSINCPSGTTPFISDCEVGCLSVPK